MKALVRLAAELALVQVGFHLMGLVDTAVAGRLGGVELAATGLGASVFFAITVLGMGLAMAVDPLAAQAFGARHPERAWHWLWQGCATVLLAAPLLAAATVVVGARLESFGVEAALAAQTREYIGARLFSIPAFLLGAALRSYLQAAHQTRPILVAVLLANIANLILDWLLAFGDEGLLRLGLPGLGLRGWGVSGVGWATSLTTLGQAGLLAWAAWRVARRGGVRGRPPLRWPDIGQVLALGVPVGLHFAAEVGVFSFAQVLMARLGVLPTAGHQVAIMLASQPFAVCMGVGAAAAVQVGRAVGAGDVPGARRAGLGAVGIGVTFMGVSALVMLLAPRTLASLLTRDAGVIEVATSLIQVAAAFQLVDGVQAVGAGALRGLGVTRFTFVANVVGHWLVGAPIMLGLGLALEWGAVGIWWGLTAGLAVVAAALLFELVRRTRGPLVRLPAVVDTAAEPAA